MAEGDELYEADPADFVARRAALVKRLRADKQREAATRVAALRRPSPAAWAVNQLARRHRDDLEALVRLGEELRAAQDRALGGAGGEDLRRAARERRDAVAGLSGAAARLLAERGGGVDAHLPGVTATLDAASLDAGAGATVLGGRLSAALDPPSGFGGVAVEPDRAQPSEAAATTATPEGGPEADLADRTAAEATKQAVEAANRAVAEADRRSRDLAVAAREAAKVAGERRRLVEAAEAEVATRRHRLEEAERDLAAATAKADDAQQKALQADAAAAGAGDSLQQAQGRLREVGG
jgi:hypothetical protein